MGNCTSKKSKKTAKLSAAKKPKFISEMNKEHDSHLKGLSKKIAPFTKGEVTSFGFKKKLPSQLPTPVTLTSNGHLCQESNEKMAQNGVVGVKNVNDGYQSGSSIESLCHASYRSTPKMIRKRDLIKQTPILNSDASKSNSVNVNNAKNIKYTFETVTISRSNNATDENPSKTEQTINRFGFRQPTPPRLTENYGRASKINAINRAIFLNDQDPCESGLYANKKSDVSVRSRSEGPREIFKQTLQPANSIQSGLNYSKTSLSGVPAQPGKFTFQTSHLPRPQFAVRMADPKTAKGAANNCRKGGSRIELNSSKESSTTEDSGFESYSSANNTLEKQILILDSSPGSKVRRRLPAFKGKKLEMKIVGNKFELLKKDEENSSDVVTEVSLIKLPTSNIRSNTATINTGLVEQRTNQYLRKIQQPLNIKENDVGVKNPKIMPLKSYSKEILDSHNCDEGLGAESEEEKLSKDSRKSEKSCVKYLMSDDCGEGDDILPGEAMAEDLTLCLSFEEETSSDCTRNTTQRPAFQPELDITPNTIRLDALKLSKELKYKISASGTNRKNENSMSEFLNVCEKDEDTFPSDSILEQLSDSDSIEEKQENKQTAKDSFVKIANENLDKEDLGIDMDEEENVSKSDTDVDVNDLELNLDDKEIKEENKNCLGTASPDSPGTPTHASNSLSLSDGRDFLIDDEIADQPQLCLSESYVDCSCQEEVKTSNEKTVAGSEFVTCCDVQTNTVENENEMEGNEKEVGTIDVEFIDKPARREEMPRLNSEGTLSPCESIASDDLMLDFEMNSFEETRRSVGGSRSLKSRDASSNCSTPTSKRISEKVRSPVHSSRSTPAGEDSIRLDKISYQNMYEDIASMKSMLLKLKRLLLESEGGLQENGRIYPEGGTTDNIIEEELTDLRRQVLFLQQQLEEREKMVQILRLEVNKSCESKTVPTAVENRRQTNAATQTGLDQFQQDFPHFRIFQVTPVV